MPSVWVQPWWIVVLAVLVGAPAGAADRGTIRLVLRAEVQVPGPKVRLAEVAEVHCPDARLRAEVEAVEVAMAPLPLHRRVLSAALVLHRARTVEPVPYDFVLGGAPQVEVRIHVRQVTPPMLASAARAALEARLPATSGETSVEIAVFPPSGPIFVPDREFRIAALPGKYGSLRGRCVVNLGLYMGDKLYRRVTVPAMIRVTEPVVVARRMIGRDEVLGAADVRVIREETTSLGDRVAHRVEDVVGLRTRRRIKEGQVIPPAWLEEPPLVARGARVTLQVSVGEVTLTTPVEAREDGHLGETITVENLVTQKVMAVRVVGVDLVVVD